MTREEVVRNAALAIGHALNDSHHTGAPIHELTRGLLGNAQDFGEILEAFADIIAPIIEREIVRGNTHPTLQVGGEG